MNMKLKLAEAARWSSADRRW